MLVVFGGLEVALFLDLVSRASNRVLWEGAALLGGVLLVLGILIFLGDWILWYFKEVRSWRKRRAAVKDAGESSAGIRLSEPFAPVKG